MTAFSIYEKQKCFAFERNIFMTDKKVELLAPAGDFSCFMAAIQAGADAVYLGGNKFGARAYANNFTEEEIIKALKIAHLFQKKIYLTVNTLVKDNELDDLIPYLTPLVENGLDGVIIQDIGVFQTIKETFPQVELHASTQMTITGKYGAKYLQEMGACRIVPARELSLSEIKEIKNETGLSIETFVHGAMCYGYSGQCLFSSILGGRSGNRGRCAGPCRLPYYTHAKSNEYPLSLKDMYTLPLIPKLIEAGIDSFKIEGRMKSPEYVAGVTSMYRKYIDQYLTAPEKEYKIVREDELFLRHLYIRSDICEGYYSQHNGKNMVTLSEPGYSGCDEQILQKIRNDILQKKLTIPICASVVIQKGEPAVLSLWNDKADVTVYGAEVLEATNRPLSNDDISQKINKLGDTFFSMESLEIVNDGKSFLPVKAINELRREACEQLEKKLLSGDISLKEELVHNTIKNTGLKKNNQNLCQQFHVVITTLDQLSIVLNYSFFQKISISSDLFLDKERKDKVTELIRKNHNVTFYLALPHILRKRSYKYLSLYEELLNSELFAGVLIRNMEEYQWCRDISFQGEYIADYSIYIWNKKTDEYFSDLFHETTHPLELNKKELLNLGNFSRKEMVLYTRIPMMYSANCIRLTYDQCINDHSGKQNIYYIVDRYKNQFPILQNCFHCYNTLYNTVPMSLHGSWEQLKKYEFSAYRVDLTIESRKETEQILDYFEKLVYSMEMIPFPFDNYTNGHFKRGVE